MRLTTYAYSRAIALVTFGCAPVDFYQHRIVNLITERTLDSTQVDFQPVAGELHAISETACEILHKEISSDGVSLANHEARD